MPIGPKGEKRLADVIGNAAKVMRIATGEEEDRITGKNEKSGRERKNRRQKRAASLTEEQRSTIAQRAAKPRPS